MDLTAAQMTSKEISEKLSILAEAEINPVRKSISELKAPAHVVVLMEACRVLDWCHVQDLYSKDESKKLPFQDLDIIDKGWNSLIGMLLQHGSEGQGIPLSESNNETFNSTTDLLHKLGRHSLLKENSEMLKFGMADGEYAEDGSIVLKMAERIKRDHFLDRQEKEKLNGIRRKIMEDAGHTHPHIMDLELLNKKIADLVFPWNTGKGMMIGYDAHPDVDNHFLAVTDEIIMDWHDEAGIHPEAEIEGVPGGIIIAVGAMLVTSYLKHIAFIGIGKRKIPEANYAMSLTIWQERSKLIEIISTFIRVDAQIVSAALDLFTLKPYQREYFLNDATPFVPMLIEISKDQLLCPVSSILRNPFQKVRMLHEANSEKTKTSIRIPRENWMIEDLYGLFSGPRFDKVNMPIKLKRGGRILTDIDAAILDRTTGQLCLVQLKWQDFSTNQIRQQRSKAKNFVDQIDDWAFKVESWIEEFGVEQLCKALQLKLDLCKEITSIKLFAIGRSAARFQSYGYMPQNENVATAVWPQFVRIRYETGIVENIFEVLHEKIQNEKAYRIETTPMPYTFEASGKKITFADLWNGYGEDK